MANLPLADNNWQDAEARANLAAIESKQQPQRLYVSPAPALPINDPSNEIPDKGSIGDTSMSEIINHLLGAGGEKRYQLWPERLLEDAVKAPHDVGAIGNQMLPSEQLIKPALDMAALSSTGGLGGADATLGAGPFLRPALKYEGKIYKAPIGGEHMDAIPLSLRPEFTRQAMSGEDISNFNFGFMNHKGHFLSREDALKYAIDNGLLSEHDAKFGALTSTMDLQANNQAGGALKLLEDAGHLVTPEKAKFRLGQLLRDKAASKKAGDDVEGSDYMFYNNQIRALRNHLKENQ